MPAVQEEACVRLQPENVSMGSWPRTGVPMSVNDDKNLPGRPRRLTVKLVRHQLRLFGIQPNGLHGSRIWIATWEWAAKIANSYYRQSWPSTIEIASQYVF